VFEYRQAEEVRDAFARHGVRYLFLGKSGAILLGYPDTTQDADVYVDRSPQNGEAVVRALADLGFDLSEVEMEQTRRGKDFIQLKNGPAACRSGRLHGLRPRRHHRQQTSRKPAEGPRVSATT
jgi:hypothetical protein